MSLLHVYLHLRNLQAFRRLLSGISSDDQPISVSSSPSRSLKARSSGLNPEREPLDVNARDSFGRTVLHLVSASTEASSVEYIRLLLKCPGINVNALDGESQWTPLHRAMYVGNLAVVLLLLQHPTTDPSIKDLEGFTAFDLYNSTIEGTQPDASALSYNGTGGELFTWGVNRNALLAHGDSSNRAFPDQVYPPKAEIAQDGLDVETRFARAKSMQVKMGKLHTAVISASPSGNSTSTNTLSLCGFGSGGRLGNTQHTQYTLKPVFIPSTAPASSQFPPRMGSARERSKFSTVSQNYGTSTAGRSKVISVALGQDHTLALTDNGEVFSWGLNRFAQLGYAVESGEGDLDSLATTMSGTGEQIQLSPRRVYGSLKKEFVIGVAACKGASACWVRWDGSSESNVYTWGLNGGQLGYDRVGSGSQIQVFPRKVTKITKPVTQIAMMESAMACLLGGSSGAGDVLVVWGDRVARINFPTHTFPSPMMAYRPPQAMRSTRITKIVCSDDTPPSFSASTLTSSGAHTSNAASSSSPSATGLSSLMQSEGVNNPPTVNFACVSEGGEVFVFGAPGIPPIGIFAPSASSRSDMLDSDAGGGGSLVMTKLFRPQRVWALKRGLIGAVKDVAIGIDGTLVVCTVSGHVYVRSRSTNTSNASMNSVTSALNGPSVSPSDQSTLGSLIRAPKISGGTSGGKSNKFSRVPFLQRVVSVCASSTGAFGAIRVDATVPNIIHPRLNTQLKDMDKKDAPLKETSTATEDDSKGWDLADDMTAMRPWMWKKPVLSPLDRERIDHPEAFSFFSTEPQTEPEAITEQFATERAKSTPLDVERNEERGDEGDVDEDKEVNRDVASLIRLWSLLADLADKRCEIHGYFGEVLPYGADVMVSISLAKPLRAKKGKNKSAVIREFIQLPAHRPLLAARSKALCTILSSPTSRNDVGHSVRTVSSPSAYMTERGVSSRVLEFTGFHPLTVLVLLEYLYTDNLICTWDPRISSAGFVITQKGGKVPSGILTELNVNPSLGLQIKAELQVLSQLLELPEMSRAMESVVKRWVVPTLKRDLARVYREAQNGPIQDITKPDVAFLLADKEVFLHSTVLRARSELFDTFLGESMWTKDRWGTDRCLKVDLKHVRCAVMDYVLSWMCCGETENLFGSLSLASSIDDALEFLFDVIAVANELLLSPLILLTSQRILTFLHTSNACYILSEATHYNVQSLIASVQGYIAADLETFLENRMLEALAPSVVKQLSFFVRAKQEEKSQFVRGGTYATGLMEKWKDWPSEEDLPSAIVPSVVSQKKLRERKIPQTVRLSPPSPSILPSISETQRASTVPDRSPLFNAHSPNQQPSGGDDLFDMDGLDIGPPSIPTTVSALKASGPVPAWKASSVPRVDMRALLMQEANASQSQRSTHQARATPGQIPGEPPSSSSKRVPGPLQRQVSTDSFIGSSSSASRTGGSPWAVTATSVRPPLTSIGPPTNTYSASMPGGRSVPSSNTIPATPTTPPRPSQPQPATPPRPSPSTQPSLGPVFTPAKVVSPKQPTPTIVRRTSSSNTKAWVSAPTSQPATVTSGMSFIAIQQLELELEQGVASQKEKRSLADIQREEQEKRQEEDFLKWWEAEKERVRLETEELWLAEERSKEMAKNRGKKLKRKPKGKPGNTGTKESGAVQPNTSSQAKGRGRA
ncbi:hypothetical protein E1B28_000418 [Marasmius oreades]|uniref:BTB/POZ domain-containing protein n=1 Tax=Marasmius oreades TaxID=181124 RepID=A0A9P8AEC4_9AGAR|nr:uncharacterized protein E1B28_000418 [Marasmius oreades]KAG7098474.1 hypothetical protein E1B28_000418 [Marasmius oreades]